jgi:5-(aminomethyl)-3-furanmethanol phosphate kinase
MDAVVKVGGSLAPDPKTLRGLCSKLVEYSKDYKIVIVPGGGRFADVVRDYDKSFTLSQTTSHKMAILGMDQYALMLSDIMPKSRLVNTIPEIEEFSRFEVAPILMPSSLMFAENPLENSWDVTSDSIAAYVANRLRAAKLVLITNVDGIFKKDPREHVDSQLIRKITAEKLLMENQRTSVDKFLPKLLMKYHLQCFVTNGKHPERIRYILAGKPTICTEIPPSYSK